MSVPIKGDEAVDKLALAKHDEACQYIKDKLNQLSELTLTGLLSQVDEVSVQLKTALEWRLKQKLGGGFVSRLNKAIVGLDTRVATLEQKLGEPARKEEEKGSLELSSEALVSDGVESIAPTEAEDEKVGEESNGEEVAAVV